MARPEKTAQAATFCGTRPAEEKEVAHSYLLQIKLDSLGSKLSQSQRHDRSALHLVQFAPSIRES